MTIWDEDTLSKCGVAVKLALENAGSAGMTQKAVHQIIRDKSGTGQIPSNTLLGSIMIRANLRRIGPRYYTKNKEALNDGAAEVKHVKEGKVHEFEDAEVTIKRKGLVMTVTVKYVKIILPVILLAIGAHLLGYI